MSALLETSPDGFEPSFSAKSVADRAGSHHEPAAPLTEALEQRIRELEARERERA